MPNKLTNIFKNKRKILPKLNKFESFRSLISMFSYKVENKYLSILYSIDSEKFVILINLLNKPKERQLTFNDNKLMVSFRYDGYLKNRYSKKMEKTNRKINFTIGSRLEYFDLKKQISEIAKN
jgi:ABC-type histidine transport system ATPase subunit